jgi:hypothetical protein
MVGQWSELVGYVFVDDAGEGETLADILFLDVTK